MKQMNLVGVLVILLLGAVGCGESQSSEVDRLRRENAALDRENQQLWEQADLHKKEPWRSLANWNRIRMDMTKNQVIEILGHPRKVVASEWRYGPIGDEEWECSVTFQGPLISSSQRWPGGLYEMVYGEPVVSEIDLPSALK